MCVTLWLPVIKLNVDQQPPQSCAVRYQVICYQLTPSAAKDHMDVYGKIPSNVLNIVSLCLRSIYQIFLVLT